MTRVEWSELAIAKLKEVNAILENELDYDWSVTDSVAEIIDSLEHDLGELLFNEAEESL